MEYRELQDFLERIKEKQKLVLSRKHFLNLDLVEHLLKEAVGKEEVLLTNLLVDPERGNLAGNAEKVTVLGTEFPKVRIHLYFAEVAHKLQAGIEILTKKPAYEALAGLDKRFAFTGLSYSYCFTINGEKTFVSGNAGGYIALSKKKIPILLHFMPDSSYILMMTNDDELERQREAGETVIGLDDAFGLLGVEELDNLMPADLREMLQEITICRLSLEYESRKQQITRFSVGLATKEETVWKPAKNFEMTLSEVELEIAADSGAQEGVSFSITVSGKFLLEEKEAPIQVGFHSEGKAIYLKVGGEKPVCLGSLAALAAFAGEIDTSVLPFSVATFFLNELFLEYSAAKGQISGFSLILSVQEAWKLLELFEVKQLSFGVHGNGGETAYKLAGVFELGAIEMELEADYDTDGWRVAGSAGYEQTISLTELMGAVTGTGEAMQLPDFWLTNLRFESKPGNSCYELSGTAGVTSLREEHTVWGGSATIGLRHGQEETCFGIRLNGNFDFSALPFVGGVVEELDGVSIGRLTFFYSDRAVADYTIEGIAEHVTAEAGLVFLTELMLPQGPVKLCLPLYTEGGKRQLLTADSGSVGFHGSVAVNKTIGPFAFQRLIFSYRKGEVGLGICASYASAGLALTLDGLTFTYEMETRKIAVCMEGLSLSVDTSGFSLAGGFLRENAEKETYSGFVRIQAGSYGIALYGAYEAKPYPSAFLFGMLKGTLGGPPCFLVTGMAAGFGYSRTLVVPSVEALEDFSLMAVVTGKKTADDMREEADKEFPAKSGANWIAAGITANSFQMVDLAVLATVLVDQGFCLNLLGRADVVIPKGEEKPFAEVGLLIKLTIDPGSGLIPVEGVLTKDSYVFSKDCHISGGFAFYMWYAGAHAGDFVISLGGYQNGYAKPVHYPSPDRLRLSWKLSPELSVSGSLYFALTPSYIMAGGDFQMVFEWKCVYAWFHAYTDIKIGWKPYSYTADIGISIGVKVELKLFKVHMELGCDLAIWGPDFSGIAHVHLWIISFTIKFGKGETKSDTISVDEFCTSFLPGAEQKRQLAEGETSGKFGGPGIRFAGGLIDEHRQSEAKSEENRAKVVNGQQLVLEVKSQVPLTAFTINGQETTLDSPQEANKIWLRPCRKETAPKLVVELKRSDGVPMRAEWEHQTIVEALPSALWTKEGYKGETANCCTGLSFCVAKSRAYRSLICRMECREDEKEVVIANPPEMTAPDYDQTKAYDTVRELAGEETDKKRRLFLEGFPEFTEEIDLSKFGDVREIFCVAPVLVGTGGRGHG
ncbi:MAG: hypothetical protein PUJ55_16290 [Clostridiales bacterium]|nr:hypothetical protein [Roseburia sp.]MDD7638481.1 hypothetical protein [Clostridiales bacterium]MDY4113229.1 DUF6603 domain-containing protein [Roseburia sp.]